METYGYIWGGPKGRQLAELIAVDSPATDNRGRLLTVMDALYNVIREYENVLGWAPLSIPENEPTFGHDALMSDWELEGNDSGYDGWLGD